MSNSTYCEDHYEQPDWMKKIQGLEKQNKELRELLTKKEKESIDKEKIRKEVERLRKIHQMKYQQLDADSSMSLVECGKRNLCNDLLSFIDSLQEDTISEDLYEAAEDYAATGEILPNGKEMISFDALKAFKAGAQWQKDKMMTNAINIEASLTMSMPSICISLPLGVNVGDKVKVIVIKED